MDLRVIRNSLSSLSSPAFISLSSSTLTPNLYTYTRGDTTNEIISSEMLYSPSIRQHIT